MKIAIGWILAIYLVSHEFWICRQVHFVQNSMSVALNDKWIGLIGSQLLYFIWISSTSIWARMTARKNATIYVRIHMNEFRTIFLLLLLYFESETLRNLCIQFHDRLSLLENQKYDLDYAVARKDYEASNHSKQ